MLDGSLVTFLKAKAVVLRLREEDYRRGIKSGCVKMIRATKHEERS